MQKYMCIIQTIITKSYNLDPMRNFIQVTELNAALAYVWVKPQKKWRSRGGDRAELERKKHVVYYIRICMHGDACTQTRKHLTCLKSDHGELREVYLRTQPCQHTSKHKLKLFWYFSTYFFGHSYNYPLIVSHRALGNID